MKILDKYCVCDICNKRIEPTNYEAYICGSKITLPNAKKCARIRKIIKFFAHIDLCIDCIDKLTKLKDIHKAVETAQDDLIGSSRMENESEEYVSGYFSGIAALYDRIKQLL